MTRTAVINQKGGVGKTTTTVNLGAALAGLGKQVLLLDLDPQANLTLHMDSQPREDTTTITSLFLDGAGLTDLIQETSTPGLHLLPADTSLAGVEQALANRIGRETLLREALDDYSGDVQFDFLLIDCPPSLGVLSANALVASEQVLIPVQAEYLALQGMAKLTEVIQLVQRRLNPPLKIACILPCMVDLRTNLAHEVMTEIQEHFSSLLAHNLIRANVKLAEAPSFGRTIFQHAPESNGALDYRMFAEEFLALEQVPARGEPEPEVERQAVDAMEAPSEPSASSDIEPSASEMAPSASEKEPSPSEMQPPATAATAPSPAVAANPSPAATSEPAEAEAEPSPVGAEDPPKAATADRAQLTQPTPEPRPGGTAEPGTDQPEQSSAPAAPVAGPPAPELPTAQSAGQGQGAANAEPPAGPAKEGKELAGGAG